MTSNFPHLVLCIFQVSVKSTSSLNQGTLKSDTWKQGAAKNTSSSMGRSLSTSLYSGAGNKSLRLYCKIRYLTVLLRKHPRLAKAPRCLDTYRKSVLSSPLHSLSPTRKYALKNMSCSDTSSLRGYTKDMKHFQLVRFYSSSSRNSFKAEAPIGILEEAKSSFNLSSFGGRLGQSFNRLSRHINVYFGKSKDIVPLDENACVVVTTPDYHSRSQSLSQRTEISEGKDKTHTLECKEISRTAPPTRRNSGLQLFHISSLTTTFGESYSYVSNHINSVFSRGSAKVEMQENPGTMSTPRMTHKRHKRRRMQNTYIIDSKNAAGAQAKLSAEQAPLEKNITGSWEDGFRQFARHINKYFGAKVTDEGQNRTEQPPAERSGTHKTNIPTQSTSQNQYSMYQTKQEGHGAPETRGLFHSSHNATNFGENYFQMASHINQYFKSQSELDEDLDGDILTEMDPRSAISEKTVSFMDCLRHPTSAIPDLLGSFIKLGTLSHTVKPKPAMTSSEATLNRKVCYTYSLTKYINSNFLSFFSNT